MYKWIYLLIVFDLVPSAAAVWVRRLPPHQGYAFLLDLLRSQLTDQRWCYKEEKKERERRWREMSLGIPVSFNIDTEAWGVSSRTSETVFTLLYFQFLHKAWLCRQRSRGEYSEFSYREDFTRKQAIDALYSIPYCIHLRWESKTRRKQMWIVGIRGQLGEKRCNEKRGTKGVKEGEQK